jgi:molybdopterin synthase sulfur carrier subunit
MLGCMAKVIFTSNLQRHVDCRDVEAEGATLREVLDAVFAGNGHLRSYILDDQSGLRKHMAIIVDGAPVRDRIGLSDRVSKTSKIYVLQALSGG